MSTESAERYLRDLAESELRRHRGAAPEMTLVGTEQVRAVAAAFARAGVLDPDVSAAVIDDLTAALEVRSAGDPGHRSRAVYVHRAHRVTSPAVTPAPGPAPSVTPAGELLELRDGETDTDVYLIAAIGAPALTCLSTGILSLPKGSLPRRREKRQGLPPQTSRVPPGFALPGVPGDLRAVDDAGRTYDLIFNGGGDNTWFAGQFALSPSPRAARQAAPVSAAWLEVGNDENSVRVGLTARVPAVAVTATANGLAPGEQFLRIRAEAMFASQYQDIGAGLPALAAVVPALRAVGMLPEQSVPARQIAALCHRYAVTSRDMPAPAAALPGRWTSMLTGAYDHVTQAGGVVPPAAAHLPVAFPVTDGVATVLSGLVTLGPRTTLTGAFFGVVEQGYPEGPCIWLRDDRGQWHVAKPGSWGSGDVNIFGANVIPPVPRSAASVDVLVITRTADLRASVPLTWWT